MNIEHYTYLLANPQKVNFEDLKELDQLVQKYPYFQSARALQLKALKNQESFRYNDALKITAAYTSDRDILFEYITSDKFIQNEISQTILQQDPSVLEIEVVSEDFSEKIKAEEEEKFQSEKQKAHAILHPDLFQRKMESVEKIVDEEPQEDKKEDNIPTLDTESPLEFTKSDTHSFGEWLKLTKAKRIDRSEEKESKEAEKSKVEDEEKTRKFELIEKFIQEKPRISPVTAATKSTDTSVRDLNKNLGSPVSQPSDSLMTETLARVYLQQKNYKKAIQAYKILILKNPEKSGFFADQIRAIEKMINTEEQ